MKGLVFLCIIFAEHILLRSMALKILPEDEADLAEAMKDRSKPPPRHLQEQMQSSCSCYQIKNEYCCFQPLCVCNNLCWNGRQLVGLGGVKCAKPVASVPGGPLRPIPCEQELTFRNILQKISDENKIPPINEVSTAWLTSRQNIDWRMDTSFLLFLDQSTTNLAHFVAKAHQLLLVNNATVSALKGSAEHIVIHRAEATRQRMRKYGTEGFHATLLRTALVMALQPLYGPLVHRSKEFEQDLLLGDLPMAHGRVEFEVAFNQASEENPICLENVVVTGHLKGITYVGGTSAAKSFIQTLKKSLNLNMAPETPQKLQLLWIQRTPAKSRGRRALAAESIEGLRDLLNRMDVEVNEMDFDGMTFKDQIKAVQAADIVISLHGAGLTNAASFGKSGAVVIEIMPYKVYLDMFGIMAVNAGLSYMMHQCKKGPQQPKDELFDHISTAECNKLNMKCLQYYLQYRNVELTATDFYELEELLKLAKRMAEDTRRGLTASSHLRGLFGSLCLASKKEIGCRENILRSPAFNASTVCVLYSDCS